MKAAGSYPAPDSERKSGLGLARAVSEAERTPATAENLRLAVSQVEREPFTRIAQRQSRLKGAGNRLASEWEIRRIVAPVNGKTGEVVRNPDFAAPDAPRFGEPRLDSAIVLVAANVDLSEKLSGALADSDLALLHAQSKQEATALLERLKSPFDLAIIDLGLPDVEGWDLIVRLTRRRSAVRIIAATLVCSERFARQIGELGVDAVVPRAVAPKEWRKRVEAALAA